MINFTGVGTITDEMVRKRAGELAIINGRTMNNVSQSDWDQAKRELTGEPETDPKEALLEAAPESERWNPLPGSNGHVVPVTPSDDEDAEGRSIGERLVDAGVQEAEHDQMLQAAHETEEKDRREP